MSKLRSAIVGSLPVERQCPDPVGKSPQHPGTLVRRRLGQTMFVQQFCNGLPEGPGSVQAGCGCMRMTPA